MLRKKVQYSHIHIEMTPLCVERDKLIKIGKTLTWTFVVEFYSPVHRLIGGAAPGRETLVSPLDYRLLISTSTFYKVT